jgi:hypothetical protein
MKGPRSRHRFNVLRVWECPACKRREFVPPQVSARSCLCKGADQPVWMTLIEPKPRFVKPPEAPHG